MTNPFQNPPQTVAPALLAVALSKHKDSPAAWIQHMASVYRDTIRRARLLLITDSSDAIYAADQLDTAEATLTFATAYALKALAVLPHDLDAITADKETAINTLKAAGL